MASQADLPRTYILSFKSDRIPSDLEATVARSGGTLLFRHEATGVVIVSGVEAQGAAVLASHAQLEAFDADAYTELDRSGGTFGRKPRVIDPTQALGYFLQWNMDVIKAPAAWQQGRTGSPRVSIGIMDTGIDYLHPEFAGLLDVARSRSFVDEVLDLGSPGDLPFADYEGHGTMVASLAASNAQVTAGVTASSRLVALKACVMTPFPDGSIQNVCPVASTLWGLLYAADQKIDVVNMSLGGLLKRGGKRVGGDAAVIRIIRKVFNYAHSRGVTVVVASGNTFSGGVDMDAERGSYRLYCDAPHVICVSATGPTGSNEDGSVFENVDAPASYSNFGSKVTVAAPGGSFWELPSGGFGVAFVFAACSGFVSGCESRSDVINASFGTSLAAPQVAGLAALLVEDLGRHPNKIEARIAASADDLGPAGKDPHYGFGRINIERALTPVLARRFGN